MPTTPSNNHSPIDESSRLKIPLNGVISNASVNFFKKRHTGSTVFTPKRITSEPFVLVKRGLKSMENLNSSFNKPQEPLKLIPKTINVFGDKTSAVSNSNGTLCGQNPLCPSKRFNTTLDMLTYMNVSSPGFTKRIVDKASETSLIQNKFLPNKNVPTVSLNKQLASRLSKYSQYNGPMRIAPPEPSFIEKSNTVIQDKESDIPNGQCYLQALRDLSRKRNYVQEEDEINDVVKKTKKNSPKTNSIKNKRSLDDTCSDNECRKKKCDEDRSIARMLSYTSSIGVLSHNQQMDSKKRKAEKLERNSCESSPEAVEKQRKLSSLNQKSTKTDSAEISMNVNDGDEPDASTTKSSDGSDEKTDDSGIEEEKKSSDSVASNDSSDNMVCNNNQGSVIKLKRGRILNRTNNCYIRKNVIEEQSPFELGIYEPGYSSSCRAYDHTNDQEEVLDKEVILNAFLSGKVKEAMSMLLGDTAEGNDLQA